MQVRSCVDAALYRGEQLMAELSSTEFAKLNESWSANQEDMQLQVPFRPHLLHCCVGGVVATSLTNSLPCRGGVTLGTKLFEGELR